jgi:hypothetical protein
MSLSLGSKEKLPDAQSDGPILTSKLLPPEPADAMVVHQDQEDLAKKENKEGSKDKTSIKQRRSSAASTRLNSRRGSSRDHRAASSHAANQGPAPNNSHIPVIDQSSTLVGANGEEDAANDQSNLAAADLAGTGSLGGNLPDPDVESFASNEG